MNEIREKYEIGNTYFDIENADTCTGIEDKINSLAKIEFTKYPPNAIVTKLDSTLEIKQTWLFNEWEPECQFSKYIKPHFAEKSALDPVNKHPNIKLIESVFHSVRGKWALWQQPREEGRWKKVVADLPLEWVKKHIEVLYPSSDRFSVSKLNGIVLWREAKGEKYQLYEGNHRISAWLAEGTPAILPAVIFIGKPKKSLKF